MRFALKRGPNGQGGTATTRRTRTIAAYSLGLSWLCTASLLASPALATERGKPAPALSGATMDGGRFDLAASKGKVVLVDFWATWCEPCKLSLPRYDALQRRYAAAGLTIVAVSVDEDREALRSFVAKNKLGLTILHDGEGKAAERWGTEKMPTAYLVGRDGKVTWIHAGYGDGDEVHAEKAIIAALAAGGAAGAPAPSPAPAPAPAPGPDSGAARGDKAAPPSGAK